MCVMCVDCFVSLFVFFCFFKQKTAYEMRISDWSSDVCSSDLGHRRTGDLKGVKTMTHEIRESWLNAVAQGMAPLFEALDAPLPDRVRVAIGFTSRGAKGKAIGECWDNRLSADGHFEI